MAKRKAPRAIILKADDWEGLYIDDKLVCEGHHIEDGTNYVSFLQEMCNTYFLTINDFVEIRVGEEIEGYLEEHGRFPESFSNLPVGVA